MISFKVIFMNTLYFLLGISQRLNCICRRFGTLYLLHLHRQVVWSSYHLPMKMEQIEGSETSTYIIQTPGKYPKENNKFRTRRKFDIKNFYEHSSRWQRRSFEKGLLWVDTPFLQYAVGQLFETVWHVETLTLRTVLPEDGADQSRKTSEC